MILLTFGTTLSAPASSAQGAELPNGTVPGAEGDGPGRGVGGAVGFVLIGGWLLLGGVLLWRGQRRLTAQRSLPAPDAELGSADRDAEAARPSGVAADDAAAE